MVKEDFHIFVRQTLFELKVYAEFHKKKFLPNDFEFSWIGKENAHVIGIENVINEIIEEVYISSNEIYPCVNLIVKEVTPNNKILVYGAIAGYKPRPMGIGWSGKYGPFIFGV